MGVSDGVWECGKPKRFSIISMPHSEGEKGEVTFSLRPLWGQIGRASCRERVSM